jgi:tetratricopeptide (TPR) repeat protein
VKARATCLVGDLLASGPKPDFKKALALHMQALQSADSLCSDPHPAIRVAAKEVKVDAFLGAAHDIAWGEWKDKATAVPRWLDSAKAVAEDLAGNEGGSQEQLFHVHARALAAYVGMRSDVDPAPTANAIVETGEKLIAAARDSGRKARLQWELGMALYDAVQVCQMRSETDNALKFGEVAAAYLADAVKVKPSTASGYLLGRLYFRLGTLYSMQKRDYKAAVAWFDKAVPLLERAAPEDLGGDLGRQGEAFVGMGVSYWEIGQREQGVALTKNGIKWMEQAAKQGTLERSTLAKPYSNLAAMHRKLGDDASADHFHEMADRVKSEKLR